MSLRTANKIRSIPSSPLVPTSLAKHLFTFAFVLIVSLLFVLPACAAQGKKSSPHAWKGKLISGQVRDADGKALRSVKVQLWTRDGSVNMSMRTDKEGLFRFDHPVCDNCYLEVEAPRNSGLVSALMDGIPGDETRNVLISLKQGFPVTGRVVGVGRGLKGIVIKAYSKDHDKDATARVYGGGAATTGRDGNFKLLLTPGDKKLVLLNNQYEDIAKDASLEVKVVYDTKLGDIEMPAR